MATANKDEAISRFIAVTQCSSSREAREYLETAKWNEQAAIDFYFDSVNPQESASEPNLPPTRSERAGLFFCKVMNVGLSCLFDNRKRIR